ncbi:hypothetical protein SAY86_004980 [Trapa natans]|uniref:Uncharacterized protein n=1 Tax=Trapa natans TaxID=22666 RepID=A0AAN7KZ71_TRANT|nr:hypothetical protein SAY86_004980 [Trapa natans]
MSSGFDLISGASKKLCLCFNSLGRRRSISCCMRFRPLIKQLISHCPMQLAPHWTCSGAEFIRADHLGEYWVVSP